jgi:hypothetical protein
VVVPSEKLYVVPVDGHAPLYPFWESEDRGLSRATAFGDCLPSVGVWRPFPRT